MTSKHIQAPAAVVMIRPHRFHPNPETASDNAFQRTNGQFPPKKIAKAAYDEVTAVAARLEKEGVKVHIFEDRGEKETPDSVFPNNWFSNPSRWSCGHLSHVQSQSPPGKAIRYY